jgi:uncharacterized protein YegL
MDRRTLGGLFLGLVLVLAWAARPGPASLQGALEARIDELNDSEFPVLHTAVTVTDAVGRPVVGLQPEQFQASAGGVTLPVTQVQSAADNHVPMGLVLAFDVSKSMEGPALEQAREAGRTLIGQLLPIDQVAVLAFATNVQVLQPFTADRGVLLQAIDGLNAGGDTALYQAVASSSYLAASSNLPRRAVVLLSDGEDFGGRSTVDRATSLTTVRDAGMPVFVVGLGDAIDRPYLEELAAAARSPLLLAPSPEELQALYSRIGETLRHQYVVTVNAQGAPPGDVTFRLAVTYNAATAVAERPLTVPAPPAPTVPSPPPAVVPVQEPAPASSGGGISPIAFAIVGAAVLLVVVMAGILVVRRRRQRRREAQVGMEHRIQSLPPAEAPVASSDEEETGEARPGPAIAQLALLSGTTETERYPLGEAPATIGSAPDCTIRLPDGKSSSRVRVWRREGKFMLHSLSRRGRVAVGGRPVTWAVLEDGDEIEIGPHRLRFRLLPAPGGGVPGFLKDRAQSSSS